MQCETVDRAVADRLVSTGLDLPGKGSRNASAVVAGGLSIRSGMAPNGPLR